MFRRATLLTFVGLLILAASLQAHDLFLKLRSYFLEPGAPATAFLLNGTFLESDAAVGRDRMRDVSVVGPRPTDATHPEDSDWRDSAKVTWLRFRAGAPGTYVLGVSTRASTIELSGEDFDAYLRHDGLLDELEARRESGRLGTPAREEYAKHVKAVVQVGERRSEGWKARLGYPVELVPRVNPYELSVGDTLPLQLLEGGEPLPGQLVYAAWEGWRPPEDAGPGEREPIRARTDGEGVVEIPLGEPGRWYVRLIHLERTEDDPEFDYVSKWATLTFEVR